MVKSWSSPWGLTPRRPSWIMDAQLTLGKLPSAGRFILHKVFQMAENEGKIEYLRGNGEFIL